MAVLGGMAVLDILVEELDPDVAELIAEKLRSMVLVEAVDVQLTARCVTA